MNRFKQQMVFGIVLTFILVPISACNEHFEPWQENDRYHFSIYGYLDASADTQWVRVMPVREELFLEPKPIDVTVTLEHIESGESVIMNDSLFSYAHGVYAWNYWTTMNLHPSQAYRLTAEYSEGGSSYAQVTLPDDYPIPQLRINYRWPGGICCSPLFGIPYETFISIEGAERLADIQAVFTISFPQTNQEYLVRMAHLQDTVRTHSGEFQIRIDPREDFDYLDEFYRRDPRISFNQHLGAYDAKIYIAAAGPDYHHFPSIHENIVALPEGISNIVDGVGYLAGIVSKTIPYKNCYDDETDDIFVIIPCNELLPPPW